MGRAVARRRYITLYTIDYTNSNAKLIGMNNLPQKNYIARDLFPAIARHAWQEPEITLLTGSRQVGKSVLLSQLHDYLIQEKKVRADRVLTYNLDLVQDYETLRDQRAFIEFLRARSMEHKLYVLVDEAQKLPEAASYFKGLYDSQLNIKLILTGSAALETKSHIKETLAGRKRVFWIPTFNFSEMLRVHVPTLAEVLHGGKKPSALDAKELIRKYQEYALYGGYPRVVLAQDPQVKIAILREIYSSYVERDAIGFFSVTSRSAFVRLIKLLAAQTGQPINIAELAINLAISRITVERYLEVLEDTFIVRRISPYFTNPRQEIVKAGKVFFLDSGIRNLALDNFQLWPERVDQGALLENSVFADLARFFTDQASIHFWKTKQGSEVDFVIERGTVLMPLEVKTTVRPSHIPASLHTFIEKFKPSKAAVVSLNQSGRVVKVDSAPVHFIFPFALQLLDITKAKGSKR